MKDELFVIIKGFSVFGQTVPAVIKFFSNISLRRLDVIRDKILLNTVERVVAIDSETSGLPRHREW